MNDHEQEKPSGLPAFLRTRSSRMYSIMAGGSLLVCFNLLSTPENSLVALLVVLMAVAGLLLRWIITPILFLICCGYLIIDPYLQGPYLFRSRHFLGSRNVAIPFSFQSGLLCLSIVVYVIAAYRLLSFTLQGMYHDPGAIISEKSRSGKPCRPEASFTNQELVIVLLMAVVASVGSMLMSHFTWSISSNSPLNFTYNFRIAIVRFLHILLLCGGPALLAILTFRVVRLYSMNPQQARMILHDYFRTEIGREQNRIYRWQKWYRKKHNSQVRS